MWSVTGVCQLKLKFMEFHTIKVTKLILDKCKLALKVIMIWLWSKSIHCASYYHDQRHNYQPFMFRRLLFLYSLSYSFACVRRAKLLFTSQHVLVTRTVLWPCYKMVLMATAPTMIFTRLSTWHRRRVFRRLSRYCLTTMPTNRWKQR